jgi:hypothetical protein
MKQGRATQYLLGIGFLILALGLGPGTQAWQELHLERIQTEDIPAAEFSRIIREFSEADGFFRSDNFVSNETSYLHILDRLKELGASGGSYLGVGPEQNYTYIAKIRPRIAFIVDIRRQAMIQHLLLKAIFYLSEDRPLFFSYLLSKPLGGEDIPDSATPLPELLDYFAGVPATEEAFAENLARIQKVIAEEFLFPLSDSDNASLQTVYVAFRREGLNIQYRSTGGGNWSNYQWSRFPTLKDLVLETDLHGKLGNFLARDEDYAFVRGMHLRNRIIPIVGDFAGPKALSAVGDYLRKNGYTVTAFYTSNVEQYLFSNGVFGNFTQNVRKLPITDKSVFIRAFPNMGEPHPARISGHRLTTLLQMMSVFLLDVEHHLYPDYWTLVSTHFIAAQP